MKIEKIDPACPETAAKIASVYKTTFGSEPWNEGWVCPSCQTIFPLAHPAENCPACASQGNSILLREYWPLPKIVSDFQTEMAKPKSLCLVAVSGTEIVGFAWGYEIIVDPETDRYLEAPGLHQIASGAYFYLDEAAILPPYQGQGIGSKIIRRIFAEQEQNSILLRTLKNSRMFRIIQKMDGRPTLSISRDRVIMTLDLPIH